MYENVTFICFLILISSENVVVMNCLYSCNLTLIEVMIALFYCIKFFHFTLIYVEMVVYSLYNMIILYNFINVDHIDYY